jgi:hypothetical protein
MAQALLKAWNLDPDKETTSINARQRRVLLGRATGLQVTPDGLSFVWQTKLSQPYDPKWDTASLALAGLDNRMARRELKVINLPNGDYLLKEDGTEIMEVNHKDLYQGVTLVGQPSTALQKRGAELLKLIGRRRKLLSDAWLGATGHQRPGMAKGLPLAEAEAKAAVYGKEIHAFAEPVEVKIELSGRVTTPGKK